MIVILINSIMLMFLNIINKSNILLCIIKYILYNILYYLIINKKIFLKVIIYFYIIHTEFYT